MCVCFFFFWLPTKSKFCCQSKGSDPLPRPLIKREKTDASVSFGREESATFSSAEVPRDPQGTIVETMELKKGINYGVSFETISKGKKKNEQISTTSKRVLVSHWTARVKYELCFPVPSDSRLHFRPPPQLPVLSELIVLAGGVNTVLILEVCLSGPQLASTEPSFPRESWEKKALACFAKWRASSPSCSAGGWNAEQDVRGGWPWKQR